MTAENNYQAEWAELRRRERIFLIIFLSYLPVTMALGLVSKYLIAIPDDLTAIILTLWIPAFLLAFIWRIGFQCPRCRQKFFSGERRTNAFARKCMHCHLPKGGAF